MGSSRNVELLDNYLAFSRLRKKLGPGIFYHSFCAEPGGIVVNVRSNHSLCLTGFPGVELPESFKHSEVGKTEILL